MAQLQAGQREQIKGKNFAIPGKEKYPIHDLAHARNALVRVRQFGSSGEKSRVYSAVTKKYPALATRSDVVPQKLQRKAERKTGVGKGQESMKVEKAKQKLSSVMVHGFTDELLQIKEAQPSTLMQAAMKNKKVMRLLDDVAAKKIPGPFGSKQPLHIPGVSTGKPVATSSLLQR